jgi:murein DD-endopeptidase MepM/ murein hydrolase activator NlpD
MVVRAHEDFMARNSFQRRSNSSTFVVVFLVAIAGAGFLLLRQLRLPPPASIDVASDHAAIGRRTQVTVTVREPKLGLEHAIVTVNGAGFDNKVVASVTRDAVSAQGRGSAGDDVRNDIVMRFALGKDTMAEIKPGTLTLDITVQARGTKLRRPPPVVVQRKFEVRLDPPPIRPTSQFVHPAQGGAEAVVYEVGPTAKKDGVQVGPWFFPGFPLPGAPSGSGQRFALFAIPYDMDVSVPEAKNQILLIAEDDLGNRNTAQFVNKLFPRPLHKDVIDLKDSLMKKVTEEIYAKTPELTRKGTMLEDYLQLNGDLRRRNMNELVQLAQKSQPKFLWTDTFLRMHNAALKGSFADRRAYMAGGKQVDTQDHLGFDLASLERAPVQAANAGRVVLARYLGIFGNCVVVDHGYGLMSLYAHLSSIGVKDGDAVGRGQELGRSGATGLAGGDHLHFTLLLAGLPVTPIEWWDPHWIQDRLKLKLGDALPFKPSS